MRASMTCAPVVVCEPFWISSWLGVGGERMGSRSAAGEWSE
jgi:hypothetical protein